MAVLLGNSSSLFLGKSHSLSNICLFDDLLGIGDDMIVISRHVNLCLVFG